MNRGLEWDAKSNIEFKSPYHIYFEWENLPADDATLMCAYAHGYIAAIEKLRVYSLAIDTDEYSKNLKVLTDLIGEEIDHKNRNKDDIGRVYQVIFRGYKQNYASYKYGTREEYKFTADDVADAFVNGYITAHYVNNVSHPCYSKKPEVRRIFIIGELAKEYHKVNEEIWPMLKLANKVFPDNVQAFTHCIKAQFPGV